MVNTKRALSLYQSGKLVLYTLSCSTRETPSAAISSLRSSNSRILPHPGDRTELWWLTTLYSQPCTAKRKCSTACSFRPTWKAQYRRLREADTAVCILAIPVHLQRIDRLDLPRRAQLPAQLRIAFQLHADRPFRQQAGLHGAISKESLRIFTIHTTQKQPAKIAIDP